MYTYIYIYHRIKTRCDIVVQQTKHPQKLFSTATPQVASVAARSQVNVANKTSICDIPNIHTLHVMI